MKGIFVDLKDIMTIRGVSDTRAGVLIQLIRDALGKKKHQKLTVEEYCDYEGITIDQFLEAIHKEIRPNKR